MTDLEIMRAARALITPPGSWTQGEYARDSNGLSVSLLSERVKCFCALGSIKYTANSFFANVTAFRDHIYNKYGVNIHCWNDHPDRTHAEVLAEFDELIAKLEAA